jgi:hypothetical protein
MMESKILIEQLRDKEAIMLSGLFWCVPVMKQAAKHIEALEARIAELEKRLC